MNLFFTYSPYVFFGILPSLLWLQFYLRKDVKPEPKKMILKVFFYGVLSAVPAIFLEKAFFEIKIPSSSPLLILFLNIFIGVAFIEEVLKFLVIRLRVLDNPEFDEPIDAMIYMIIAALGFAAAENLLILFSLGNQSALGKEFLPSSLEPELWQEIFEVSLLRFLGATFLHALSSAVVGFFIGLSFFRKKIQGKLIAVGLALAVLLHGLYNFSIIIVEGALKLFIPCSLLLLSAVFISSGFRRLKKIARETR